MNFSYKEEHSFIPCPVSKAAGSARDGSTNLATETVISLWLVADENKVSHVFSHVVW